MTLNDLQSHFGLFSLENFISKTQYRPMLPNCNDQKKTTTKSTFLLIYDLLYTMDKSHNLSKYFSRQWPWPTFRCRYLHIALRRGYATVAYCCFLRHFLIRQKQPWQVTRLPRWPVEGCITNEGISLLIISMTCSTDAACAGLLAVMS